MQFRPTDFIKHNLLCSNVQSYIKFKCFRMKLYRLNLRNYCSGTVEHCEFYCFDISQRRNSYSNSPSAILGMFNTLRSSSNKIQRSAHGNYIKCKLKFDGFDQRNSQILLFLRRDVNKFNHKGAEGLQMKKPNLVQMVFMCLIKSKSLSIIIIHEFSLTRFITLKIVGHGHRGIVL